MTTFLDSLAEWECQAGVVAVTAWFAWDHQRNGMAFNHVENGHSLADKPVDPFGRRWHRNTWEKRTALLVPLEGRWGAPVLKVQGPVVKNLLAESA